MHATDPQKLHLGKAIGRVPSGVFILTTRHGGRAGAIMASWVQQSSFDPPALSDALAWLECRVTSTCDFGGDHELIIAQIVAGEILKEGKPFMHVRGNGFHY